MTTMIPYGRQDISEADIQAVVEVLRSDYLTQGPAVSAFEKSLADYCGAQHRHRGGVFSHKMDYRKLLAWHPHYTCFSHKVGEMSGFNLI